MSLLNFKKTSSALIDNTLSLDLPANNFGNSSTLELTYSSGVKTVVIIQFTIPAEITSINLESAVLTLYQVGWIGIGDPPGQVNVTIKNAFLDNQSWTETASNWTRGRVGGNWNVAGAYQSPDIITSTISSQDVMHDTEIIGKAIQMNVIEAVKYALNNNKALSLSIWIETNESWNYASSEYATVSYRPTIEFGYNIPQKPSRIGKRNTPRIPSL